MWDSTILDLFMLDEYKNVMMEMEALIQLETDKAALDRDTRTTRERRSMQRSVL